MQFLLRWFHNLGNTRREIAAQQHLEWMRQFIVERSRPV